MGGRFRPDGSAAARHERLPGQPRRTRAGIGCGIWSRRWPRSSAPRPPRGSAVAAEWVAARLRELGAAEARVESEPVHGTFWWPLGLAAAAGVAAGIAALRGRRLLGGTLAGPGRRGRRRRSAPREAGRLRSLLAAANERPRSSPSSARGTPSARSSWWRITTPRTPACSTTPRSPRRSFGRFPWLLERVDTSPPLMAPVVADPPAGGRRGANRKSRPGQGGNGAGGALGGGARRHRLARRRPGRQRQRAREWRRCWRWRARSRNDPPRACG